MARYRSCPAVSQIWALIVLPSTCIKAIIFQLMKDYCRLADGLYVVEFTCMLLVANSTPIVDFDSKLNSLRVNRDKRLLFPTPESPMRTTEMYKGK